MARFPTTYAGWFDVAQTAIFNRRAYWYDDGAARNAAIAAIDAQKVGRNPIEALADSLEYHQHSFPEDPHDAWSPSRIERGAYL